MSPSAEDLATAKQAFASARLKWDRASVHAEELYGLILAWMDRHNPHAVRADNNDSPSPHVVFSAELKEPLEQNRLSVRFGDALFNLRCALDHATFAAAAAHGLTGKRYGEFPICAREPDWENIRRKPSADGTVKGGRLFRLPAPIADYLWELQPCNRGIRDAESIAIQRVAWLNNKDKHRMVRTTFASLPPVADEGFWADFDPAHGPVDVVPGPYVVDEGTGIFLSQPVPSAESYADHQRELTLHPAVIVELDDQPIEAVTQVGRFSPLFIAGQVIPQIINDLEAISLGPA